MEKMLDAAVHADATALIAHGRFLDAKFGRDSSGGSLDMNTALPNPNAAPPRPSGPGPVPPPRSSNDLDLG